MPKAPRDEEREKRIHDEAIVDCYGPQEQALGWHYYLGECLRMPFRARCVAPRATSPLREGEEVTVTAMAPQNDCLHEVLVMVAWEDRTLAVPLAQLDGIDADEETAEAIADWHYWVARGYEL